MAMARVVLTCVLMIALGGCAALVELREDSPALSKMRVQIPIAEYIGEDVARAEQVSQVVSRVKRALLAGELTTVQEVERYIRDQVRWDEMRPSLQILLNDTLVILRERHLRRTDGVIEVTGESKDYMLQTLAWVDEVARRIMDPEALPHAR